VLCGYCHLVFHPTCLDPLTGVENWDELAELNAIEYAVKYATKTKPGDYVIDCAPPVAGGAAAAAAVAASEGGAASPSTRSARSPRTQRPRPPSPRRWARRATSAGVRRRLARAVGLGPNGDEAGGRRRLLLRRRRAGGGGGRERGRGGGGGGHPPTGCQPTGPPNPNPTRARRTPRHTRRD
jgi:hypothetical protein